MKYPVHKGTKSKIPTGYKDVAYRVDHTNNHVNWSGRKSISGRRLEPRYSFNGELFCKNEPNDPFWTCLGYAPNPITDYDKLMFHFYNGMIMKYGFINSLCFTLRHYYKRKKKKWLK